MVTIIIALSAFALGFVLPIRWGVFGFIGAAIGLFFLQAGINIGTGYGGIPIEDSLGLFGDSWASYTGFNLKITYRAFAPVLLALAAPFVFRLSRDPSPKATSISDQTEA